MSLEIQNDKRNRQPSQSAQYPIDMGQVQSIIHGLLPISNEYVDRQGNRVRLWERENTHFYGTVLDRQGKIKVIASHKIINPLCKGSSTQALQKIKQLKNARWDLTYSKLNLFFLE